MHNIGGGVKGLRKKLEKKGYVLHKNIPSLKNKVNYNLMINYINQYYRKFIWDDISIENKCLDNNDKNLINDRFVKFNKTQDFVSTFFNPSSPYKGLLLWHSVGTGKCHGFNTPILMFDGSIKMVQNIIIGDKLMGDDSTYRNVLSIANGIDYMFDIIYDNGEKYTVNLEHILVLFNILNKNIIEITVKDYLNLDNDFKKYLKGIKTFINLSFIYIPINPYIFGFNLNIDYIPYDYKYNDYNNRLNLLYGILDSKSLIIDNKYFLSIQSDILSSDIIFLARSLGFIVDNYIFNNTNNIFIYIDKLLFNINISFVGVNNYYGFTLDGNNRYLLGDFTITHNTCTAIATASKQFENNGYTILWVTRHTLKPDIWKNMYNNICSVTIQKKINEGVNIPQGNVKAPLKYLNNWIMPISYKQFSNLLNEKNVFYKELVKINGSDDPLRKTLVIIDEVHKIFSNDLPIAERPNIKILNDKIKKSYDISKNDSVRLLLMTATPYTNNPMDLIKIINLMKESNDELPFDFDDFKNRFLDDNIKFTTIGREDYLNSITGYISYLNREKDIRQFAYPVFNDISVNMSDNSVGSKNVLSQENVFDKCLGIKTEKICPPEKEINPITKKCVVKCKDNQIRNIETGKCDKKK